MGSQAVLAAEGFPARNITLVVPYPPGGTADILARELALRLATKLGKPVVVDNKAGAGTAIGARYVAEAAPDGHTLLLGTVSSHAINPATSKVGYDPARDFVPVAPLTSIPFVLVTKPDSPFQSTSDIIRIAKEKPGSIGYASAGPGTSNHLAGVMFGNAAGVQLLHVPYRGSAPALADVMAGHVPLMFDLQTTAMPNIRQEKLRPLAVTGQSRIPALPNVPTLAESGLPGYEVSAWFAVFAPAKVPQATLNTLSQSVSEILRSAEMSQRMTELGADPDQRSLADFKDYFRAEVVKYSGLVKAAGLAP